MTTLRTVVPWQIKDMMANLSFVHGSHRKSLSWSETPRLSVGLRVQVRRRVAGDDPRTDQNDDGKGV